MKLAVIFNGQGAHYEGMGMDFVAQYETAKSVFDAFEQQTTFPIRQWITSDIQQLSQTRYAQVAITATSLAIYYSIQAELPAIDYMAGLSLGEYSALVAGGYVSLESMIPLLQKRGEFMSLHCETLAKESPAQMVAVMGSSQSALQQLIDEAHLSESVFLANINSSQQIIVAGTGASIEQFTQLAKAQGIKKILPLKVEGPFHSPLMAPVCEPFGEVLAEVDVQKGQIPVVSNTTLDVHTADTLKEKLVQHLVAPVQWQQTIDFFVKEGVTHLIQIGPGQTLVQLLKRESHAPQCFVVDKVEDVAALQTWIKGE